MVKKLDDLIRNLPVLETWLSPPETVGAVQYDSRKIHPDHLFVALVGQKEDGHIYLKSALDKGATCAIVERIDKSIQLPQIKVPNTRIAIGEISNVYFDYPSRDMILAAITGSNGKTSCSYLFENVLKKAGRRVGLIGTVEYRWSGKTRQAPNTTPLALELHGLLAEMNKDSVDTFIMEVSSHALALDRIHGLKFDASLFTNLTQDHLDFHQTMSEYQRAKERLFFEYMKPEGVSVINLDDEAGVSMARKLAGGNLLTYSIENREAHIHVLEMALNRDGIELVVVLPNMERLLIRSPLLGLHNVYNFLGTIGLAYALEIPSEAIKEGIDSLTGIPGRLEEIPGAMPFKVLVDYAHTEDALRKMLLTLRDIPHRKLIVVTGAGGDRDKTKRPKMGKAAAENSDLVILTSDNPRTEDPRAIIRDIEAGMVDYKDRYIVIVDRAEAIRQAVRTAREGDIVVLAGKGHERTQTFGNRAVHFDDREQAAQALKELAEGKKD